MKKALSRLLLYLLPGLGDILWMGAFVGVLGLGPRMMNIDGDLGRHLTIGSYILDQGRVPTLDLFSHTLPGQPLTPHEWLAQVIFALANRVMGLDGVVLVCGLVIATSFWLVYRQSRNLSQKVLASVLVTVLAMAASSLHWLTRPHIFTFLMLVLWISVLENLRSGRLNRWWLLPVLMVVWANLHGAFIAGFATWFLYGLGLAWDAFWRKFPKGEGLHGHFWRYYLSGGAAAFLATLINPAGVGLWSTSVGYVGNHYLVSHTAEYHPPNFQEPSTWPFMLMIMLPPAFWPAKQTAGSSPGAALCCLAGDGALQRPQYPAVCDCIRAYAGQRLGRLAERKPLSGKNPGSSVPAGSAFAANRSQPAWAVVAVGADCPGCTRAPGRRKTGFPTAGQPL